MIYNAPSRNELLKEAIIKREDNNSEYVRELLRYMSLEDYVLLLYTNCTPSVYGKLFEKRLYIELYRNGLYIEETNKKEEKGDVSLYYPKKTRVNSIGSLHQYDDSHHTLITDIEEKEDKSKIIRSVNIGKLNLFKRNYEIKFSYLGKNNCYTVRNVRDYHDFDYYILAFVDTYDDFKINYYCIEKGDVNCFNLSPMNGTYSSNIKNENINYGFTIKNGSYDHRYVLKELNLLDGTSFNDLLKFMIEDNLKLRKEIFRMLSTKGLKFDDGKVKYKIRKLDEVNPENKLTERLNELSKLGKKKVIK
jgi:hypothetical protein